MTKLKLGDVVYSIDENGSCKMLVRSWIDKIEITNDGIAYYSHINHSLQQLYEGCYWTDINEAFEAFKRECNL